MAKLDKDELRRLSPEERIKKLREVEDERKKELKEAEKLILESISELQAPEDDEPPDEPTRPPEEDLESQLQTTEPPPEDEQNVEYAINLYDELQEVAEGAAGNPYQALTRAAEIYDKIMGADSYKGQDSTVKNIAEGSRRLMKEIFGEYKASLEYRPDGHN